MAVDRSQWDAGRALRECETPAEYAKVCALDRGASISSLRDRFGLPHHYLARHPDPNAGGVRAALQAIGGARVGRPMTGAGIAEARGHLERHAAEIRGERDGRSQTSPVEVVRSLPGIDVAEPPGDGTLATVRGHLARFGEWAEIDSPAEGHFLERVAPGSFADAIVRDRSRYRVLLEHGADPVVARRPLGPIRDLREDERGVAYEFALLDTEFGRELLPGLRAGLYGSSFAGRLEHEVKSWPERSEYNPTGLEERVVRRVALLRDFGPTAFPAYAGATALARSADRGVWTPARRRERLIEVL